MDITDMDKKFKVKYNTISWGFKGTITSHETTVKAEDVKDAVKKVLIKTKGHAINLRAEELENGSD
ncbi:hypothetical protein BRC2024_KCUCJSVR_CDS_0093 [Acinetobacter phage vB_AbaM_KissB]